MTTWALNAFRVKFFMQMCWTRQSLNSVALRAKKHNTINKFFNYYQNNSLKTFFKT